MEGDEGLFGAVSATGLRTHGLGVHWLQMTQGQDI